MTTTPLPDPQEIGSLKDHQLERAYPLDLGADEQILVAVSLGGGLVLIHTHRYELKVLDLASAKVLDTLASPFTSRPSGGSMVENGLAVIASPSEALMVQYSTTYGLVHGNPQPLPDPAGRFLDQEAVDNPDAAGLITYDKANYEVMAVFVSGANVMVLSRTTSSIPNELVNHVGLLQGGLTLQVTNDTTSTIPTITGKTNIRFVGWDSLSKGNTGFLLVANDDDSTYWLLRQTISDVKDLRWGRPEELGPYSYQYGMALRDGDDELLVLAENTDGMARFRLDLNTLAQVGDAFYLSSYTTQSEPKADHTHTGGSQTTLVLSGDYYEVHKGSDGKDVPATISPTQVLPDGSNYFDLAFPGLEEESFSTYPGNTRTVASGTYVMGYLGRPELPSINIQRWVIVMAYPIPVVDPDPDPLPETPKITGNTGPRLSLLRAQ